MLVVYVARGLSSTKGTVNKMCVYITSQHWPAAFSPSAVTSIQWYYWATCSLCWWCWWPTVWLASRCGVGTSPGRQQTITTARSQPRERSLTSNLLVLWAVNPDFWRVTSLLSKRSDQLGHVCRSWTEFKKEPTLLCFFIGGEDDGCRCADICPLLVALPHLLHFGII